MLIGQSKQVYSQWGMPKTEAESALSFDSKADKQDSVSVSAEGKSLQQGGNPMPAEQHTYSKPQPSGNIDQLRNPEEPELTFLEKAMQSALDKRIGIDRKRLEEIEEKIREIEAMEDAIRANENMPKDQKDKLLKDLGEEKAKLIDMLEAEKKRMAEEAAEKETQKDKG